MWIHLLFPGKRAPGDFVQVELRHQSPPSPFLKYPFTPYFTVTTCLTSDHQMFYSSREHEYKWEDIQVDNKDFVSTIRKSYWQVSLSFPFTLAFPLPCHLLLIILPFTSWTVLFSHSWFRPGYVKSPFSDVYFYFGSWYTIYRDPYSQHLGNKTAISFLGEIAHHQITSATLQNKILLFNWQQQPTHSYQSHQTPFTGSVILSLKTSPSAPVLLQ